MSNNTESRIAELEWTVERLLIELSTVQSIIDSIDEKRWPWNLSYVENEELKKTPYKWKPVKSFPIAERNLLIKELHRQGMDADEIPVALFERNHKTRQGGIWSLSIIEKVLSHGATI